MSSTHERSARNIRLSTPSPRPTSEPIEAPETAEPLLRIESAVGAVADQCRRHGPLALRLSLALVFLWFGALKLTGATPVEGLISATLPFLSTDLTVPALGVVEIVLGAALVVGRAPRATLLALAAHLMGTFLTFVTAPRLMFDGGNPLLLTADGEFVLKNLVLVSAALVLVGTAGRGTPPAVARRSGQV
jgi:putative oxidoreductase